MIIYSSLKVMPYVYMGIHKITDKIYIGSRSSKKQKLPSHLDLLKYRTSSKIVRPIFDEFDWHIVAEFFNPKDAYDFEQYLIHEQWQVSKEMSLNRFNYYGKKSFNTIGIENSKEHRKKIGNALRGKPKPPRTEEHKQNMRKPHSEEHKQNLRKPKTKQHIRNSSKIIDVLTPDGFIIENTTMREICYQFNLNYNTLSVYYRNNKPYKGFQLI